MYTNDGKCRLMETAIEFDVSYFVFNKSNIVEK